MCDACAFEEFITLNRSFHSHKIKEKQTLRKHCNDKKIQELQHLFVFVHYTDLYFCFVVNTKQKLTCVARSKYKNQRVARIVRILWIKKKY